ncbi:MAG: glycosyltransferase family 39 protein [Anaerolineales bacterium]
MTTPAPQTQTTWLNRQLFWRITPAHLLVLAIMLLSLALHLTNLSAIGYANTYYTAAAKSMTQSWHNFFFVAAEPGGSVTVDKPPLGLWIEAAFAFVLGVKGWVVALPNILAGIFSIPVLYILVKKYFGIPAGLIAALVLVLTPIAIATNRNNTMDGMLVFTLLFAAWAFVSATETGKARWLYLGAFIVGLGFNIKMLQAFLPLPAFYALYFFGAKNTWLNKILNIGISGIILLAVSLSWAILVDLTPADQRPYIGSSTNNTVMELIVGHNGFSRLFGHTAPNGDSAPQNSVVAPGGQPAPTDSRRPNADAAAPPQALAACQNLSAGDACAFTLGNGNFINGTCITPPQTDQLACAPPGAPMQPPNGGSRMPTFSQETGVPGIARFFIAPLSKQMSWLLPFALVSIVLAIFSAPLRLPLEPTHQSLVLWGGWLLTCLIFFSMVEGIFHAYYTIMLAPPLGALVGSGFSQFGQWQARRRWSDVVWAATAAGTIAFQIYTAAQYGVTAVWVYLPVLLLLIALGLRFALRSRRVGDAALLAALLLIPLGWTLLTVSDAAPEVNLPTAFSGTLQTEDRPANPARSPQQQLTTHLLPFLQANTQDTEYLIAVPSSHEGAALVLATGRPVLYMGGFGGNDRVIDAAGLAELVAAGKLRYILLSGGNNQPEIAQWLQNSCTSVPQFDSAIQAPNYVQITLYRCSD